MRGYVVRKGVDCKEKEWEEISLYGKMIDVTDKRFGKLVALFPVRCRNATMWLCQCDCGNSLAVSYNALSQNNTRSCGCAKIEKTKAYWDKYRNDNSIIGKTFGELTAIEFIGVDNYQAIYRFRCSCGKHVDRMIGNVRGGSVHSCGHLLDDWRSSLKTDIIGQKFGRLVVRSYVGVDNYGSNLFECDCDCGATTILPKYCLIEGRTKSCGCLRSIGENNIKQILDNEKIKYKPQFSFKDLTSEAGGYPLYDFAILDDDEHVVRLIEFDGLQHERPYEYFGGEEKFKIQRANDILKNQYAISHNIPLVRIPYSKRDTITLNDLLSSEYLIKEAE